MSLVTFARRAASAVTVMVVAAGVSACSSSYQDTSDYVSPIAATPAPPPVVPVSTGAAAPTRGRLPLLPPVPEEEASRGLPPVTVATLLPPPPVVR